MIALFMAGGSGTRLWPLSRENNPKQLHALVGKKSLMTQTIERVAPLIEPSNVWVVTNEKYAEQIAAQSPGVPPEQIITEPFALGTNLAVGLGIIHIARRNPDAIVMVGWADAHIGNDNEFRCALEQAERVAAETDGVILSVRPTYAATGYGYIELGEPLDSSNKAFKIARFEEKPNAERAQTFVDGKRHLWNPGISIWKVSTLLDLMRRHTPDHYAALQTVADALETEQAASTISRAFKDLPKTAIDNAIFEKATNLATIPVDLDWNDIGAWSAIYDVQAPNGGNVIRGSVVTLDTDKCLIYADKRLVATIGVSDLVIVETDDAILIAHKNETARLKEIHAQVKELGGARYL